MQSPGSNCCHLGDLAGYTNRPPLHTASGTDARRMRWHGRDPRPHREATQYAAVGEHPMPQTAAASQGRTREVPKKRWWGRLATTVGYPPTHPATHAGHESRGTARGSNGGSGHARVRVATRGAW